MNIIKYANYHSMEGNDADENDVLSDLTFSRYERLEEGEETITQLELFTINKGVVSNLKFLWKKY